MVFVQVALAVRGIQSIYTYSVDKSIYKIMSYVVVEFRSRIVSGVILGKVDNICFPLKKLKPIILLLDIITMNSDFYNIFIKKVVKYNILDLGCVMKMAIPISFNNYKKYITNTIDKEEYTQIINNLKLSEEQYKVYNTILSKINNFHAILLDGVTGSGKTAIFISVINDIIQNNSHSQALILLPEIMLTSNIIIHLRSILNFEIIEWNSSLTEKNKKINWYKIVSGKAKIIIGTRSALMLPYKNLRIIVVDEEHDSSYKQEVSPSYNARDMAILRAKIENIPVILSSATPSLETIYNVNNNKYIHLELKNRYGNIELPEINLIDMKLSDNKESLISEELYDAMNQALLNGYQVALFINKRGYCNVNICCDCGYRFNCPHCSICLTEHTKNTQKVLICHYCGFSKNKDLDCNMCGSENSIISYGFGIERITEEVIKRIPNYRIEMLSSDVIDSKDKRDKIMEDIMSKNVDIIIGTQIIAKGHNFPNLQLVGVLDGDNAFMRGGLRDAEHMYQLLHQVSGRSGRKLKRGKVFIQSYSSDNVLLKSLKEYDRTKFYEYEMNLRKEFNMPPFSKLLSIIITSKDMIKASNFSKKVAFNLYKITQNNNDDITILGPAPASIFIINSNYRYRILIKYSRSFNIWRLIHIYKKSLQIPNIINFKIDVDPINFN